MEQADASWWGSADEFGTDIQGRLENAKKAREELKANPQHPNRRQLEQTVRDGEEAQRLLIARNARARQGRDPFSSQPPTVPPQAPAAPQTADAPRPAPTRPMNMSAFQSPQAGFMAGFGPQAQGRHLQGMIDQTTGAIADENASRVAISREQRRMAHEQEMEAMRTEALLKRLEMEAREREKDRILQKQLATGVTTRKLINGEWVDV